MIIGRPTPRHDFVTIDELRGHPLFASLPYKFLEYHDRTVVRRRYEPGQVVCREGDYGATAFLIIGGEFEVVVEAPRQVVIEGKEYPVPVDPRTVAKPVEEASHAEVEAFAPGWAGITSPTPAPAPSAHSPMIRTREDVILGEMSCLSHHPRTATIRAFAGDCQMWEIRRNFLDALRRNRQSRRILDAMYEERAIPDLLRRAHLFADLPDRDRDEIVAFLRPRVRLIRVDPGQVIFEQGQPADHFYLVRLGFVKVARKAGDGEFVLDYLGPNTQFGEIGLLTSASVSLLKPGRDVILPEGFARGTRTATVSALDDVELVQVQGEDFYELAGRFASFKDRVIAKARDYYRKNAQNARSLDVESLDLATTNGLFHANSLLVLDLEKCTRCDECTKACADTHGGVSRLTREGMRYGNFLVTTTCRSCQNPYCMAGCPVDAIHRRPPTDGREGLEIVIEDWCIGCGRCEANCPYGNISMQDFLEVEPEPPGDGPVRLKPYRANLAARVRLAALKILARIDRRFEVKRKARRRAVTCDLCRNVTHKKDQEVACVYACPHDAAHRMSGPTLIDLVRQVEHSLR